MGTIDDSGRPLPYLFEPKIIKINIGYNYEQEIFENDIIILNLNNANIEETEFIIRGLKYVKSENKKLLIIISNIMTWANTPLKSLTEVEISKYNISNLEEIPENIMEKINKNYDIENEIQHIEKNNSENVKENVNEETKEIKEVINEQKVNSNKIDNNVINKNEIKEIKEIKEENEEENELNEDSNKEENSKIKENKDEEINVNINNEIKKNIKKIYFYKEEDYPKRIPNSLYYNFKILETMALQIKNDNVKTYIVCPGFIYGCGEEFFFDYFKKSWLG